MKRIVSDTDITTMKEVSEHSIVAAWREDEKEIVLLMPNGSYSRNSHESWRGQILTGRSLSRLNGYVGDAKSAEEVLDRSDTFLEWYEFETTVEFLEWALEKLR